MAMGQAYDKTLHLPSTEFSMRGNLNQKEPVMLEEWERTALYGNMLAKNKGKTPFILHDGPPYANGDIHLGTALNKILKDFVIKFKNMRGFYAPYVPGWDTHGLPTELKALKKVGVDLNKGGISTTELRGHCHDFAMSYVDIQREEFLRLGVLGDYKNPYLTLYPAYEAHQVKVFGEMALKGYIYKGLKPVYWCPECTTALAEAEIEYANDPCMSLYVKFPVKEDKNGVFAGLDLSSLYMVIWTTTAWTLPGNLAICLGPEYEYAVVKSGNECYVMAKALVESTMSAVGVSDYTIERTILGKDLEYVVASHPFMNRDSLVIVGDHVTLESGTGCVHTAPGYGVDDFEVCQNYAGLGIVVGVDDKGILTADSGEFAGIPVKTAHPVIAARLKELNVLLGEVKLVHQYPHCWRCKSPVLFRATEQWFCSVEAFKEDAIKAIQQVEWIPAWGEERIKGMVRDRSDWCLSRQRKWGVPIPIVYCADCKKPLITRETIGKISDLFAKEGAGAWYTTEPSAFLPEGTACECGCKTFVKETDIMDVWFDSGSSHFAVLQDNESYDPLSWPADLYLEGNDQYRGWFQSSLLTSVVLNGKAPYKAVCTHGMVVDGDGRKMSKSLGNGVDPGDIIKQYGADILRLWVASSDYHSDIRISQEILKQLSEAYKKMRNTSRFILGNLSNGSGFDPVANGIALDALEEIDRYALSTLDNLISKVETAYSALDFHVVFHSIHNFCVVDMSSFYLDIIKDRLYCTKEDSKERRSAQTAMNIILNALSRMLAPILSFTAEEIWKYLPHTPGENRESIFMNDFPTAAGVSVDEAFIERWQFIRSVRESALKALEIKRAEKVLGSALEAKVTVYCLESQYDKVEKISSLLTDVFIVSAVELAKVDSLPETAFKGEVEGIAFGIDKAPGEKCERCWIYSETVGSNSEHPTICARCAEQL